MSEYWKSTPKYWCKFCKTFVRDTNLEKKAHDATPKHQSNIQRSLRDLHKTSEREEREKQRAKDEVSRLNGLVSGKQGPGGSNPGAGAFGVKAGASSAKATPEERKRQMEQLAAMGITAPGQNTTEQPTGSGWTTVSETPVYYNNPIKDEDGESKPAVAFGVRKRKIGEDEEDYEAVERKGWGSKFKKYPGSKGQDEDLDALLSGAIIKKKEMKKEDEPAETEKDEAEIEATGPKDIPPALKKEESAGEPPLTAIPDIEQTSAPVKQEEPSTEPPVVFKKRKGKR